MVNKNGSVWSWLCNTEPVVPTDGVYVHFSFFLFVRDRFDANCVLGEAKLEVNSPHAGI